jgi:glycosyltransferase involved in cell wall biosynthesis
VVHWEPFLARLVARVRSRVGLGSRPGWWGALDAFAPEVVCISQGSTYQVLRQEAVLRWALDTVTPRVHLCHLNSVFHVPAAADREAARTLYRSAHKVCFVAQDNLVGAERQLACHLPNARVVRNPVNLDHFETALNWPADDVLRLAVVARLEVRYKGHDLLLQALAGAPWQERAWTLDCYGDGPDRDYIAELIEHFGLGARVRLCGHVDNVASIWRRNQVLVLPSRAEGTPLALVEAMLLGRPALVTDVGGNAEWITEAESGVVAEGVSERSLAAALERLWALRGGLAVMGGCARQTALAKVDPTPGQTLLRLLEEAATQAPNVRMSGSIRGRPA